MTSMLALRRSAGEAKSLAEWRRTGRYATPEEIAASEAARKPWHCIGHSARTGLACAATRIIGLKVCRTHGGSLKSVKTNWHLEMFDPIYRECRAEIRKWREQ